MIHIIILIIAFGMPHIIDVERTARITFVVLDLRDRIDPLFFLSESAR